MCSFGSCQTRFEFLSQFKKVRNAFECFVTQVQTHLPKTKRVWPMKINVICTVLITITIGFHRRAALNNPNNAGLVYPGVGVIQAYHTELYITYECVFAINYV